MVHPARASAAELCATAHAKIAPDHAGVQLLLQVWVPTEFNRQTFAAAGVAAEKLFVVPQGVDDSLFDPARHQPLLLRELPDAQLITGAPLPASSRGSRRPRYGEGRTHACTTGRHCCC